MDSIMIIGPAILGSLGFVICIFLLMRIDRVRHDRVKKELDLILSELRNKVESDLQGIKDEIINTVETQLKDVVKDLDQIHDDLSKSNK